MTELKPCPFCGSPANQDSEHQLYFCSSSTCELHTSIFTYKEWNTRHEHEPIKNEALSNTPRTDGFCDNLSLDLDKSIRDFVPLLKNHAQIIERELIATQAALKECVAILEADLDSLRQLMNFAHSKNFIYFDGRHCINITKDCLSNPLVKKAIEGK